MITRKNRFHGHHSVSKVRGSTISTSLLTVRYAKNKELDFRLAVVVSKKVSGLAVTRNRIRRRVYEVFRVQKMLEGRPLDVVVYIKKPEVAKIPYQELSTEIKELTDKVIQKT